MKRCVDTKYILKRVCLHSFAAYQNEAHWGSCFSVKAKKKKDRAEMSDFYHQSLEL